MTRQRGSETGRDYLFVFGFHTLNMFVVCGCSLYTKTVLQFLFLLWNHLLPTLTYRVYSQSVLMANMCQHFVRYAQGTLWN